MKRLIDILACPDCRSPLVRQGDQLVCGLGGHIFPLVNGVPILFPGGKFKDIQHEDPLTIWPDYSRWVHRNLLRSLPDETIVVDLGSSNIAIDDPCIIRVDVKLTPFVDVVADAHALPFREESLDFIMSMAVLEHLHNPFQAGEEMFRVLKRGGTSTPIRILFSPTTGIPITTSTQPSTVWTRYFPYSPRSAPGCHPIKCPRTPWKTCCRSIYTISVRPIIRKSPSCIRFRRS